MHREWEQKALRKVGLEMIRGGDPMASSLSKAATSCDEGFGIPTKKQVNII